MDDERLGRREAQRRAVEIFPEEDVTVTLGNGHSGWGWYAYPTEYPDEGSIFIGRNGRGKGRG